MYLRNEIKILCKLTTCATPLWSEKTGAQPPTRARVHVKDSVHLAIHAIPPGLYLLTTRKGHLEMHGVGNGETYESWV